MTEFVCGMLTTIAALCFYVATWAWVHGREHDEDYETVKKRLGTLVEPKLTTSALDAGTTTLTTQE